jgi:hypothetical protein
MPIVPVGSEHVAERLGCVAADFKVRGGIFEVKHEFPDLSTRRPPSREPKDVSSNLSCLRIRMALEHVDERTPRFPVLQAASSARGLPAIDLVGW